jgi:TolB-like protein/tetratricopeptide (TPR) repeat protein
VVRVAATYVIASWVIIQVVTSVSTPLNLPDWFDAVVIVLLIIGFPVALLVAWAFELTPDGIKVTPSADGGSAPPKWRLLDTALVLALLAVAAAMVSGQISPGPDPVTREVTASADKSVAVLPFADMSPEGDQGYFADGIAEELLNELAHLDGLRVASRSASFAYRETTTDLQSVADALNVSIILEGSVRKDGDRIRVTAQLIDAADGYHLWSQTFDRELKDIFAIQEQIATATAGALGVQLGVGGSNAFKGAGTTNLEAYEAYLQSDYERAMELDPNYAAAWARQGIRIASLQWQNMPEDAPGFRENAFGYIEHALELDPENGVAGARFATLVYGRGEWQEAEESFAKSLELDRDRGNLTSYANMLLRSGRLRRAQAVYEEAGLVEASPRSPNRLRNSSNIAAGDFEAARAMAVQFTDNRRFDTELHIALNDGSPDEVRTALAAMPRNIAGTELYGPVLEYLDLPERALGHLETLLTNSDLLWPSKYHDIGLLAAYFGDPELALEALSREVPYTAIRYATLWYPMMSEVRRQPRFKTLVEQVNLVDYWRKYGWADSCRPLGPEAFECF